MTRNRIGLGFLTPVDIVVDSNEKSKNPDIFQAIVNAGVNIAIRDIGAGDYLITGGSEEGIIVERKTAEDFINSIIDSRVWRQADRLRRFSAETGFIPVILIEGDIARVLTHRKFNATAFMRALDTLALEYGFRIIPSLSKETTAKWLISRAKASGRSGKKTYYVPPPKRPIGDDDRIVSSLSVLVGRETAIKLLREHGSLREIAQLGINELKNIEGIGEKRAKKIFYLFNKRVKLD